MAHDSRHKFDPQKHQRRSIRLKGYDYCQAGAYYVTIVTYQRDLLFGEIVNEEMILNELGKIADECWRAIPDHFPFVELGTYVIMPNHVHGIIWIEEKEGTRRRCVLDDEYRARQRRVPTEPNALMETTEGFGKPVKGSIPTVVRAYKSAVTYAVNAVQNQRGAVLWQRNYYEHIIRNDRELNNIRRYILNNPLRWQLDRDNAQNRRKLPPPGRLRNM